MYATKTENITYGPPWHTVRLEALGDDLAANISVAVDGETLIEWIDTDPLPAGTITFSAWAYTGTGVFVDDFELWVPEDEVVVLGPVTPNPLSVPAADEPDAPHGLLRPAQPGMEAATNDVTTLDAPIVFQKDRAEEGATDIYLLEAGSETPLQLTNDLAHDGHPALSPDGSTVAYSRWENGGTNIYLMDVETHVSELLTDSGLGAECYNDQPVFSPDGTRLLFITRPKGGYSSFVIVDLTTPEPSIVAWLVNDGYNNQAPAWSPDGTQLAFVSYRAELLGVSGFPATFVTSATDVYAVPDQISALFEMWPDWSPDGERIAVNNLLGEMVTYAPDGTDRLDLNEIGWHPTWSPDGQFIAYQTLDLTANPIQFVIAVMAASGGDGVSMAGTEGGYFLDWGQTAPPTLPPSSIRCDAQTGAQGATLYTGAGGSSSPGVLPQDLPVGLIGRRSEQGVWWYFVNRSDDWFANPAQGWVTEGELNLNDTPSMCLEDLPIIDDFGSTIACTGRTMGYGGLNVRAEPNTNSSVVLTLTPPPPQAVSVTGRIHPDSNESGGGFVWYRCDFEGTQGWMREDFLEAQCSVSWLGENDPTPEALPDCLDYVQGASGWELAPGQWIPSGYNYHQFLPCGVTMYGPAVQPIPGMSTTLLDGNYLPVAHLTSQFYAIEQGQSVVTAHNQGYSLGDDEYLDKDFDFVACGFVASTMAARYFGYDAWPYQWIIDSVDAGVSTNQGLYGFTDFKKGTQIPAMQYAFGSDSNMDTIVALLRDSRGPVVIDRIAIPTGESLSANAGLLIRPLGIEGDDYIPHWVVVTGISTDFQWVTILNPLTNREETYPADYYETTRVKMGYQNNGIIVVTRQGIDAQAVWCDNRMGARDIENKCPQ